MPRFAILAVFAGLVLAACSGAPRPPEGKWQGVYQADDVVIVARLEISERGVIRVSAPNAFENVAGLRPAERELLIARLKHDLASAWPSVQPLELDFDGKTFRKPGGVAPQLVWNSGAKEMSVMVYPGLHASIRMRLDKVSEFTS